MCCLCALPVSAQADDWSTVSAPSATSSYGFASAVSCWSATGCMAVGFSTQNLAGGSEPVMSQTWDGTSWTQHAMPITSGATSGRIDGVSCASASFCMAVGSQIDPQTPPFSVDDFMVEQWNGSSWTPSMLPEPDPQNDSHLFLRSVSCVSDTDCTAAGSYEDSSNVQQVAIWHWDGTQPSGSQWTETTLSLPSGATQAGVTGIACVPGDTSDKCMAVGSYDDPTNGTSALVYGENWTGQAAGWQPQTPAAIPPGTTSSPTSSPEFQQIACTTAGTCYATESYWDPNLNFGSEAPQVQKWDGSHWTAQTLPSNIANNIANGTGVVPVLTSISCNSAQSCTALGNAGPGSGWTAIHTDGTGTWSQQTTSTAATNNTRITPQAISCPSGAANNECMAAGFYYDEDQYSGALINQAWAAKWDGSTWSSDSPVSPAGQLGTDQLSSVSCASTTACAAVGFETGGGSWALPVATMWDGHSWTLRHVPLADESGLWDGSRLNSVSCTSATACTAVGYSDYSSNGQQPLAEHWNGSAWSQDAVSAFSPPSGGSNPPTAVAERLDAVSCWDATHCMAIGRWNQNSGWMSQTWNGSTWTPHQIPDPSGGNLDDFGTSSISCTSASSCTVVGTYTYVPSGLLNPVYAPVAEHWDGTNWTASTPFPQDGVTGGDFYGVSCAPSGMCMAVGRTYNGTTVGPLAMTWNGSGWSDTSAPTPSSATSNTELDSVSCPTSTACTAVGSANAFANTLTEHWTSGSGWAVQTPDPGLSGALYGTSCAADQQCFAVGGSSPDGSVLIQSDGIGGPATNLLTVSHAGGGTGTVTGHVTGSTTGDSIDCWAHDMCEGVYDGTQSVVLTATPSSSDNSSFTGWSVAGSPTLCTGTGTCTVPMSQAQDVTAIFTLPAPSSGGGGGGATPTQTTLSVPAQSTSGFQVNFTANVSPSSAAGTVKFSDNGQTVSGCSAKPLSGGQATCQETAGSAAVHTITAVFTPTDTTAYSGSQDTQNMVVNAPTARRSTATSLAQGGSATAGLPVTFTASVTPIPDGGSVEFTVDGGPGKCGTDGAFVAVSTSTGKASCQVTFSSAGSHSVRVDYLGDSNFDGSNATLNLTVNPTGSGGLPTTTQILSALSNGLTPTGPQAKIQSVLKKGGAANFNPPSSGQGLFGWYYLPKGAVLPPVTATTAAIHAVLVAHGKATFAHTGLVTVKLPLTRAGKKLLKKSKRITLVARGTFTPTGGSAVTTKKKIKLRR